MATLPTRDRASSSMPFGMASHGLQMNPSAWLTTVDHREFDCLLSTSPLDVRPISTYVSVLEDSAAEGTVCDAVTSVYSPVSAS